MTVPLAPCPRCGVPRPTRVDRAPGMCHDCRATDPRWPYEKEHRA